MKRVSLFIAFCLSCIGCNLNSSDNKLVIRKLNQQELKNEQLRDYQFLAGMYSDSYFPKFLVDKGKAILVELCFNIEQNNPSSLEELYVLTHAATNKFNLLQYEFDANESEFETVAREVVAMDFFHIAEAYGFTNADIEELIATREW